MNSPRPPSPPCSFRRSVCGLVLLTLAAAALPSCETLPITGRRRVLVSSFISMQDEIDLGAEAYRQSLAGVELSSDEAERTRVRRVGKRIAAATGRSDLNWEFGVIKDDAVLNAWALPGGKVAVYTGLLGLTGGDDALLATVMGHEIAHVTHRHGAENLTHDVLKNVTATALLVGLQDQKEETVTAVMVAFGLGAELGLRRPFNRKLESEADHVGLIYMARAGYDPARAMEFWEKMSAAAGRGQPPKFLSTHPPHDERIERLRELQVEARAEFKPLSVGGNPG